MTCLFLDGMHDAVLALYAMSNFCQVHRRPIPTYVRGLRHWVTNTNLCTKTLRLQCLSGFVHRSVLADDEYGKSQLQQYRVQRLNDIVHAFD